VVYYGLRKIKLAFDAQYKIVILNFTYLLSGLSLGLYRILALNASLACKQYC